MSWLSWALAGVTLGGAAWASWRPLQRWLIVSERAPDGLREFAAGALVQGGVHRALAYLVLSRWARVRLPGWVIAAVGRAIARQQGGDASELERPVESYTTLDELFTRGINPALRPICPETNAVVSPADAEVVDAGRLESEMLIQAKGMPYRLSDLLAMPEAERWRGGDYLVLYLRAGDCHRVFCPVHDARVRACVSIPGGTMPVAPVIRAIRPQVYTQNKRLAHWLETPRGGVALVMVGAYLVGDMDCTYDAAPWRAGERRDYGAAGPRLARGEWMATFHLGSTVVLLFEAGRFRAEPGLVGRKLRYGEKIGNWHEAGRQESKSATEGETP